MGEQADAGRAAAAGSERMVPEFRILGEEPTPVVDAARLAGAQLRTALRIIAAKLRGEGAGVRQLRNEFPAHPLLSPMGDAVLAILWVVTVAVASGGPAAKMGAVVALLVAATLPPKPVAVALLGRPLVYWESTKRLITYAQPVFESGEHTQADVSAALAAYGVALTTGLLLLGFTQRRRMPLVQSLLAAGLLSAGLFCYQTVTRTSVLVHAEASLEELEPRVANLRVARTAQVDPAGFAQRVRARLHDHEFSSVEYDLKQVRQFFPAYAELAALEVDFYNAREALSRQVAQQAAEEEAQRAQQEAHERRDADELNRRADERAGTQLTCLQGCLVLRERCLDNLSPESECVDLQRRCIGRRCGGTDAILEKYLRDVKEGRLK